MPALSLPAEGGCRCGRVRLKISAKPILTMACHCTGCQRMSSSAYSLSAAIPSEGFEVTQGEPVIGGLHGASRHYFCGYCMSWMFTRPEGMDWFVNLRPTMLDDLGVREVRLLTNNPDKVAALAACGLTVKRESHIFAANGINDGYLATKAKRFGHLLG